MLWNVLKLFLKLTTSSLKLQLSQTFGTLDPLALEAEQEPLPIKNYVWAPHTCARQCRCINSSWTGEWHGEWHGEWQVVSSPPHLAFSHVATCCLYRVTLCCFIDFPLVCSPRMWGTSCNVWEGKLQEPLGPMWFSSFSTSVLWSLLFRNWRYRKSMKEYERVTKGHERHRKIPKDSVSRRVSELNGDQRSEGNRKK